MKKPGSRKKIKLLILEDNPFDVDMLLTELRKAGIEPTYSVVCTEEKYLEHLNETVEIILSDYSMPQFDAPQALALLQERGLCIPFIVISGAVGEDKAVAIMRAGASDYLLKDRLSRLGIAIDNALQMKNLRHLTAMTGETLKKMIRAVEQSADGIVVTDDRGVIEYVNPAFLRMTGYSMKEVIGKTPALVKSGYHDTKFYAHMWKTLLSGKIFRAEFVNRKKNGELFYEVQGISPVFDDRGKIINYVSTGKDITERKQAEVVLRESERRFREMLENVELISITMDKNGTVTFCNDYLLRLTGWEREEVIGEDWFAKFIPGSHAGVRKMFFDNIAVGTIPAHYQNPIKTKRGDLRDIVWNNTVLKDIAGTVIGTASIGEDMTDQKKAVESLKLFRALIDGSNDAIEVIDPVTGRFIDMNDRECIDLGYSREEMLQMSVFDVDPNVRRENFEKETAAEREAGTTIIESVHRRKDGSVFPVEVTLNFIQLDKEYMVAIVRDITERKQIERRNKLIANLGYQLSSVETSKQAAKIVVDVADQLFGWDACTVDLYFENTGLVTTVWNVDTVQGERVEIPPSFISRRPTDRMRRVLKEGSLLVLRDPKEGFGSDAIAFGDTSRPSASLMFVPIRTGDKSIGILSIQSYTPNKYSQGDIVILQGMADQCGAAFMRIRALEELRKSEANLRRAQQIGKIGSWYVDLEKYTLEWSEETFRIFGMDPKTFVPTNDAFFELVHPDDREAVKAASEESIRSGKRYEIEHRIVLSDGSVRTIAEQSEIVRDAEGKSIAMHGVAQDISERKNSENALRVSESKYRDIFTFAPVGIYQSTKEGKFLTVNKTLVSILGYGSEEELLKKNLATDVYYNENDRNRLIVMYEPKGSGTEIEVRWKKKDGSPVWIQLTSHAIKNSQGQTIFFEGFVRDINERKRIEDALRQSEERYRNLIDSAVDAIFTISKEGIFTSLNPGFENITGWRREQWLGKNLIDIVHDDDKGAIVENFRLRLQGENVPVHEYKIRSATESYVVVEILTAPQYVDDEVVGIFGVARDVTERKRLEEQIRQGQKMESIGTLAGGIAHDFNNILGIILACSTLLERANPGDKNFKTNLETISRTVQRGAMLVRQILTFARKTDIQFASVQLNEVIVELSKMLEMTIPKTIAITLNLDASLPPITVDSNQVHQALLNLCVNARDAILDRKSDGAQAGTITIATVRATKKDLTEQFQNLAADQYLVIRVSDTGIGMDEETKQRIFDPFFTTKEIGKGTGLGLAVVYGVMQSQHGFVNVESLPGKGTTFSLYFPIPESLQSETVTKTEAVGESIGGNETILVIEDEESLLELLKLMLEAKGYTVRTAVTGPDGLEVFARHKDEINLVFTDFGLPGLDGYTMLKRIKEMKPKVKMLMASGYLESHQRSEVFQLGVYEIIQKPYESNHILSKIRELLDRK